MLFIILYIQCKVCFHVASQIHVIIVLCPTYELIIWALGSALEFLVAGANHLYDYV